MGSGAFGLVWTTAIVKASNRSKAVPPPNKFTIFVPDPFFFFSFNSKKIIETALKQQHITFLWPNMLLTSEGDS